MGRAPEITPGLLPPSHADGLISGRLNHSGPATLPERPFLQRHIMATARRRAPRSTTHTNLPARAPLKSQFAAAAMSPAAKTAYAVIGTAGLAALAIAIFGPRRFQREILKPVSARVGDQASQLWADSRDLRDQISRLFAKAQSETGRERLVRNFQSWIGHFKAG
jgi:hypothetical protein